MKNLLHKYFGFTKREYNGLLALIAILIIVTVFPYFYGSFGLAPRYPNPSELAVIQKLTVTDKPAAGARFASGDDADSEQKVEPSYFSFDPNEIGIQQWQKLGLSKKQAQAIVNYRNKGGRFYKPEDLKRMYTISSQKYIALEPYIEIANRKTDRPFAKNNGFAKKDPVMVELNSADTLRLDLIKGIGAAFAKRIVKYRDRLGGFYKVEQLMEVFGLDSTKFEEVKNQVTVDPSNIKKIDINTAAFEDFKNHPYLKYKQINAILQYRKQHGRYTSIEDLKKVIILTPQNIQAIAPYLIF